MRRAAALCLIICALLAGCGAADSDLEDAYQEGYRDGETEAERKAESMAKEAYEEGLLNGANSVSVEPFYEDDIRMEEYANGFEDGYYDGRKDEKAGAPDQLEDFEAWYFFWNGTHITPYEEAE